MQAARGTLGTAGYARFRALLPGGSGSFPGYRPVRDDREIVH